MLPITTTPMTNGVSFSATNGACCSLLLSYPLTKYADRLTAGSGVTINIQSTGAFPLVVRSAMSETAAFTNFYSTTKSGNYYPEIRGDICFLIFRDNSYCSFDPYIFNYYSDYGD